MLSQIALHLNLFLYLWGPTHQAFLEISSALGLSRIIDSLPEYLRFIDTFIR